MRTGGYFVVGAGLAALAGCEERVVSPADIAEIMVQPAEVSIEVGETRRFQAQVLDVAGNALTGREIEWMIADPEIASIDEDGLVIARQEGRTRVLAAAGGAVAEASVTVLDDDREAETLVVSPSQATLHLDRRDPKVELKAEVYDRQGRTMRRKNIDWKSDRPAVARVDGKGVVKPGPLAFLGGRVTITATSGTAAGSAIIEIDS